LAIAPLEMGDDLITIRAGRQQQSHHRPYVISLEGVWE